MVRDTIAEQLKAAREKSKLSRQALVDKLSNHEKAPTVNSTKKTLLVETYKQWEYGNNPIDFEWIPAICDTLACDVGYLFGDYKEMTRTLTDIHEATGLSAEAINSIKYMTANGMQSVLNAVVSNYYFYQLLGLIYRLSEAKAKDILEQVFNSPFGDISEEYVYEAVASTTATKLISGVSETLEKERI